MKNKLSACLEVFAVFAKIGAFTFGGGYAMIPMIEDICVEKKRWISHEEMADMTVIAESTPGPVAINCATFTGYRRGGFFGALAATLGVVLPSFLIIFAISMLLDHFLEITWIAHAFKGIKIAVGVLIFDVGVNMLRKAKKDPLSMIIATVSFAALLAADLLSLRLSTTAMMLIAGAVSLCAFVTAQKRKGGEGR